MKRITKLTAAQEAILPVVRDEWLAIGLSTERADRPNAELGVRQAYAAAGLEPPRIIIWLDSPWAGVIGQAIAPAIVARALGRARSDQVRDQVYDQVGDQVYDQVDGQVDGQVGGQVDGQVGGQVDDQVRDQVYDQVGDQVYDQVGGQVDGQVRDQVRDQVYDQVYDQVDGQVYDQVYDQVDGQVDGQVGGQVRDQVRDQVYDQVGDQVYDQVDGQVYDALRSWWKGRLGGQHWAGYYSWLDAMERIGVTGLEAIHGTQLVARSAGWWWAFRDFAILTERPLSLHRDERNRLHNLDGPAIVYPDGWGVWASHGTRVPRDVIEADPATITAERITTERNAEVRRVLIERVGTERYVALMGATAVATDDWGTLWRADRPGEDPYLAVELLNSTPEPDGSTHVYWIRVPGTRERTGTDHCVVCAADLAVVPTTPHQAIAWGYSVCTDHYAPAVMT